MKNTYLIGMAALGFAVQAGFAQTAPPGAPEDNGLRPKSSTVYLHRDGSIFNNSLEGSMGVAIAANGNIMVGWEDDAPSGGVITDFEGVWTILTSEGAFVTPDTEINSTAASGGPITTKFLAYFRADGTPVSGWTSWGPKIKANLFGDGLGMGATSFDLGTELPEFANIQPGGDFPSVQLLSNSGAPVKIVAGVSDAYGLTAGNIRIGDWDYLSNGNVLIVGESRQNADLIDKYGGTAGGTHAIFRIVNPTTGAIVKDESLVSETPDVTQIWHGSAVTANGFAIRFQNNNGNRAMMRLFNNDGTPASTNIDIATVAGNPILNNGGRGESIGFDGNGKDAYAIAASGTDGDGKRQVVIAVFNANGTLRWTTNATEAEFALSTNTGDRGDRVDVAIDEKGRVFVVFADQAPNLALNNQNLNPSSVMGRLFDATGKPMGGTFYISETEIPGETIQQARTPRVYWRNNLAAVAWESRNNDFFWDVNGDSRADLTMALRTFTTFTPGTVEGAGLTRIVADTPVIPMTVPALDNWEPYASVLGNTHFLIEGNAHSTTEGQQRYVVRVQPATGGAGATVDGFWADNGTPFSGPINLSRQNGNPGRVAGDKRPGSLNYIVGGEASPHGFTEFQSLPNRWTSGAHFDVYRYGIVETFSLNAANLTPTPLTKAIDPILSAQTGAYAGNTPEVSRFGGEVAALDNGNFVEVTDDRSGYFGLTRSPVYVIIKPNGEIVRPAEPVDPTVTNDQIWSNVAAHKGGFAIRFQGKIRFYDNAGNKRGEVDQNASTETTWDRGRGDGTRIASHINSDFVYLAGGNTPVNSRNTAVKVAAFDARSMTNAGIALVSEPSFPAAGNGYDRVNLAVDALDRVVVAYESLPSGFAAGKNQTVTRVLAYDKATGTFNPLTSSFYPFVNSVPGTTDNPSNIRAFRPTVAMTTKQIMVAGKGEINLANKPELGPDSVTQLNFYTVFSHPAPAEDPTVPVGGNVRLEVARALNGNVTITWTADGYALYSSSAVNTGYTKVTTTGKSHTITSPTGTQFFKLGPP